MNVRAISANPPLAGVVALLTAAGLPTSDLSEWHVEHFFFCGPPEAPTGLVGLEVYGLDALLRSLAVVPAARHAGMGTALVAHAEAHAREVGVRSLYLLTTTVRLFFEKRGYHLTAREACPQTIQATAEFSSLCPASSVVLVKTL